MRSIQSSLAIVFFCSIVCAAQIFGQKAVIHAASVYADALHELVRKIGLKEEEGKNDKGKNGIQNATGSDSYV